MDVNRKHARKTTTLRLSGECTIYHAAVGKEILLGNTKGFDKKVELDLEQVSELDTAGVQLLLMLQRTVQQAGGTLALQAANDSVMQVFETLRLPAPFCLQEMPS